jgi:hypothetical protein
VISLELFDSRPLKLHLLDLVRIVYITFSYIKSTLVIFLQVEELAKAVRSIEIKLDRSKVRSIEIKVDRSNSPSSRKSDISRFLHSLCNSNHKLDFVDRIGRRPALFVRLGLTLDGLL